MPINNIFDLKNLYSQYFSRSPYFIAQKGSEMPLTQNINYSDIAQNPHPRGKIHLSKTNQAFNKIGAYGQDIWFPVKFLTNQKSKDGFTDIVLEIDACTVSVNLVKNIVRTPVVGRKGQIIEICGADNYKFTIRGFVIGKNRTVPETEILSLKQLFETDAQVYLHGGYPELFLHESCKIIISSLEFPEVQGKNHWIRPFVVMCENDWIDDLEIKEIEDNK